jgi:hypothetical protein
MALNMQYTFTRNDTLAAIRAGKYAKVSLSGMSGNMNPTLNWTTANSAAESGALLTFSATCWYFAEQLTDALGASAPPIGLIHTAWGGSTIEQWLSNASSSRCANSTVDSSGQEWHDSRVLPYVDVTIKGWLWYQGENDAGRGAIAGTSAGVGAGDGYIQRESNSQSPGALAHLAC